MPQTHNLKRLLCGLLFALLCLSTFGQSSLEQKSFREAEQYYQAGKTHTDPYEKGRYMSHVIGLYKSYLQSYPNSPNAPAAWFHLGHAQQTLGKIEDCKESYDSLIARFENGPFVGEAARQMAYLHYVKKEWASAAKYFEIGSIQLAEAKLRYHCLTKQIQCLINENRSAETRSLLSTAIEDSEYPDRDWARFMLGYNHYEADDFETAIDILKPLLSQEDPSNYQSQALFYTGLSCAELGQEEVAQTHLLPVLDMPVTHPSLTADQRTHLATNKGRAQNALMGIYSQKKDYKKVVEIYRKGNFGLSGKTEARRSMRAGNAFFNLKNYREARSAYRQVDRAMPNTRTAFDAALQCLICDYQIQHPGFAQRVDIFFELYSQTLGVEKELDLALFLKAENTYQQGAYDEASALFEKVKLTNLSPAYQKEMLFKQGWCFSELGNFERAIERFTKIIEFSDDSYSVKSLSKRAEAFASLGNHSAAISDYQQVLDKNPEPSLSAFALQGLAGSSRETKDYEKMVSSLMQLLDQHPSLPQNTVAHANYWIGWGNHKLGKHDEVESFLQKAKEITPEYYSQQAGNILILSAFERRDKIALNRALEEVFSVAPEKYIPPGMLSWIGVQMFHDGDHLKAIEYLEKATNAERPSRTEPGVWAIFTKALNRAERYEKSLQTANILLGLEQNPIRIAETHLELAEAQLGLKKYDDALATANKGLDLKTPGPHVAGLKIVLAEVALQQGRLKDALSLFEATIEMIPDDPILQPRALAGAAIAATGLQETSLATQYTKRLKTHFPNWQPTSRKP